MKKTLLVKHENSAWLVVFLPALAYYVRTRLTSLGLFRSSTVGDVLPHSLQLQEYSCQQYYKNKHHKDFLYLMKDCVTLQYPIYTVLEETSENVVATTWKEDPELERGYLLLSSSSGTGKVFQWETGGGPIAIGRTLHLKDSGCRSGLYKDCNSTFVGSGGIAVDANDRLMVAEYGEGRVVRLEENGARTPLVIQTDKSQRLCKPFQLLTTPHKDLMILDQCQSDGFQLWKLSKVTDIPALSSLLASRKAHTWMKTNHTVLPKLFFEAPSIGGMVVDSTGHAILVTTTVEKEGTNCVVVVRLPLEDDDEQSHQKQSEIFFDYSDYTTKPGAIEIDNFGNVYVAVDDGILMVSKSKDLMSKILFDAGESIVDLTVGSDKFLYMATATKLMRFRIPGTPLVIDKQTLLKNMM